MSGNGTDEINGNERGINDKMSKKLAIILISLVTVLFGLVYFLHNWISADVILKEEPIPYLDKWLSRWQTYGEKYYCSKEQIEANGIIETGAGTYSAWYYDGMWGAYKLSDWVSSEAEKNKWRLCATYFRKPYRDDYVLKNNGKIPGWRIFPRGLYEDYLRTGDEKSKEALILMAKNAAYAYRNVTPTASVWHPAYSREVAYNIDAYLLARKLAPQDKAFQKDDPYIDVALSHLDRWIEWLANSPRTTKCDCGDAGLQPFMVGLTIKSLYYVYQEIKDSPREIDQAVVAKIKEKVPRILDLMWEEAWGENHPEESGGRQAFYYGSNTRDYQNKEDLNLLIAPAYAFAWQLTGEERFRTRADKIFAAGVQKANIDYMGKIFSQNYFWSDDYVKIRQTSSNPPPQSPPPSSPPSSGTPETPPSPGATPPSSETTPPGAGTLKTPPLTPPAIGGPSLVLSNLVKGSGPAVYFIENGQKRLIPDPATFSAWGFRWLEIRVVSDEILGALPTGFSLSRLAKGSSPAVYLIDQGKKYHIPNPSMFNQWGFKWSEIHLVSDSLLASTPSAPPLTRLVKGSSPAVYLIDQGKKYLIPNPSTFNHWGFHWSEIRTLSDSFLSSIPSAPTLTRLAKGSSKAVYFLENGKKRLIPNPSTFRRLGFQWSSVRTLSNSLISSIPTGSVKRK